MARQNRTYFVLLGLLSSRPRSAYDLGRFINHSLSHFWYESQGQIYPSLKLLEEDGLIEGEEVHPSGRPLKVVYKILPLGREKLAEWLAGELTEEKPRSELLLKLFFCRHHSLPLALNLLGKARLRLEKRAALFEQANQRLLESKAEAHFWGFTLKYMSEVQVAETKWLNETEQWIQSQMNLKIKEKD